MRLKFENKINEIHGVHHELTIKHQKLYEDLMMKRREFGELNRKFTETSGELIRLKS